MINLCLSVFFRIHFAYDDESKKNYNRIYWYTHAQLR